MVLGCGEMGSSAVSQLVKYSDADVVAADINLEKVKKFAKQLGTDRVSAQYVDVNDHKGLVQAIKAANPDVIASCVGPFYRYAGKVYRAALETSVSCADICDDYIATKEALALNDEAKEAGITIITGLGDSPGLTNIIAKYLADKLDRVDDINLYWMISRAEVLESARAQHGLQSYDHPYQFMNGKLVEAQGEFMVDFAPPVGRQKVRYCNHPEPYTLPLYIKSVKNATVAGGHWPPIPEIDDLEVLGPSLGLISEKPIKVGEISIMPINFLTAFILDASQKARKSLKEKRFPNVDAMRIEVKGERKGDPIEYVFLGIGKMIDGTPRSLVTGAKLLAKGEIKVKGAYAPEGCIDPKLFIKEYSGGKFIFKEKAHRYYLEIARVCG
jgi:saccharopine dehydrogenase-like NADP-dependent oxidoreductase